MNIPLDGLLRNTGLDNQWIETIDAKISLTNFYRIIENALDVTGDKSLGLTMGKHTNLSELGVWGYALISSQTLGEALSVALKFWEMIGSPIKKKQKGRSHILELRSAFPIRDVRLWRFQVEKFFAAFYSAGYFLASQSNFIDKIIFSYPEPSYSNEYHRLFNCPCYFCGRTEAVWLSADMLNLATSMGHPQMFEICKKQCEEITAKFRERDKLIASIREALLLSSFRTTRLDEIASQLGFSPRTLQRMLKDRNTTFQSILNGTRVEVAKTYLANTNLSIEQIADCIGFSEETNLRHAFKRLTGMTPRTYRLKN